MIRWFKFKIKYIIKHTRKGEFYELKDEIVEIFTDPYYWVREKYFMVLRFFKWGYRLRYFYEWDAHCIYKFIHLKLEDCRKNFNKHGHLVWNSNDDNKDMKRMRECSELARRLHEDSYCTKTYSYMRKKYGKPKSSLYGNQKIPFNWENIKTEKENERAKKEYSRLDKKYTLQHKTHKDRFHKLLKDGIEGWWD